MSLPTDPTPQPSDSNAPPLADLPPVELPSAGFIVQLFVIPALVVVVVIVVWLLFGKLAGGERDAREYVRLLRSPDANWRAAFELAGLIRNDARLAGDAVLLGELTDLLAHDLDRGENPTLTQYLALTLGGFQTLEGRTEAGRPVDPIAVLSRALGAREPGPVRIAAATSLARHAARLDDRLDDPRAVAALGEAAADPNDVELRQLAAYALGFFGGEPAAALLRARLNDPDRFVRYNAAVALARRGDLSARGTLREMLSAADLGKVLELPSAAERQKKIEAIELEAIQALQAGLDRGRTDLVDAVRPEVDALTRSGLANVRTQAQALLNAERRRGGREPDPDRPQPREPERKPAPAAAEVSPPGTSS
jgi:hypothetical protein